MHTALVRANDSAMGRSDAQFISKMSIAPTFPTVCVQDMLHNWHSAASTCGMRRLAGSNTIGQYHTPQDAMTQGLVPVQPRHIVGQSSQTPCRLFAGLLLETVLVQRNRHTDTLASCYGRRAGILLPQDTPGTCIDSTLFVSTEFP